ncbi:hypothetical protein BGZ67_001059 [Mortierella alpina]|nr:hypothetical protein BGZ67_001059 [Mortierella alpina]
MAMALITAKIFLEDAVHLKDNPDRLGLVVRTWHDFESGESDSEDEATSGPLGLQQVVVHWCDGSAPQTLLEDDLVVADRSFSHGDVVKLSPNDIMSGSVIGVKVELDLERVCPPMTKFLGIDAQYVDFVQQFAVNNHIIYDGWLGVIEEVEDEVIVLLSDNSVCVIKNSDDLDLRDQIHDQSCFFPDHLAPGHAVCGPSRIFKNARYIRGTYSGQKSGYVARTEVTSITVNWLSFNPLALDQTPGVAPPPRVLDDFENIVVYKSVEQHCTYELMDRVKVVDPDTLKEEMRVIGTKTRVTVQWQDLSLSTDVYSTELVPYLNIDDQDVWPSDYVLLKEGEVLTNEQGGVGFDRKKSDMLGIVQSVNAKERTTLVKWFSEERDQGLEQDTEECSLYEIMSHPDLKFRMGDKVIVSREREQSPSSDIAPRAPSVDDVLALVARGNEICNELQKQHRGSEVFNHKMIERRGVVLLERYGVEGVEALDRYLSETNKMALSTMYWLIDRGDPLAPAVSEETLASFTDLEKDMETIRTRLNWIGQIWKVYQDRPSVLVRFMDGTTEEVPVGRIMVVEDDDDDEADDASEDEGEFEEYDFDQEDGEEISSDDSWETDSGAEDDSMSDVEEEVSALRTDKVDTNSHDSEGDHKDNSPLPRVNGEEPVLEKDVVDNTLQSRMRDPLSESEDVATSDQGANDPQRKPAQEHGDWKSFLIAEATPADHHFYRSNPVAPHSDRAWIKRIVKEHSILSSSLPEGIRVRAFDDRMDLLRVMIQGPDHTPYRNALFLFDFMLPCQFPSQPPVAFFHSWTGGIGRINPNLYEDGNVCLSLLNTWHGKDQTETWTPSSSILQLLISLQGLVLVPEPYYNEAGFEKFVGTKEAARNSELYNEKVYLLSLKAVQTILNNPPAPFQKEVRHFYFKQGKLEQIVIEGLELIARSEASSGIDGGEEGSGSGSEQDALSGPVMKRISKGALKMLKKHIDNLSLSLEE